MMMHGTTNIKLYYYCLFPDDDDDDDTDKTA